MRKSRIIIMTLLTLSLASCSVEIDSSSQEQSSSLIDTYYTVTFNSNGGSEVTSQSIKSGEVATKPENPTKADTASSSFAFQYWHLVDSNEAYDFQTPVLSDITLKAEWIEVVHTYTITFDSKGGSEVASQEVRYGELITKPDNPTKPGSGTIEYEFEYWYEQSDKVPFDFTLNVTSNHALNAKWKEKTTAYLISFNTLGGSEVEPQQVPDGGKITKPNNPTKVDGDHTHFNFQYWYKDNPDVEFDFNETVNSSFTLYAKWQESLFIYDINFDTDGGSTIATQHVTYGDKVIEPLNPSKPDGDHASYTFSHWYLNNPALEYDFDTVVNSTFTLYAYYDEHLFSYDVIFDTNGGSDVATQNVEYGSKAIRPDNPTKDNYLFDNWYIDSSLDEVYDFDTEIHESITLYAKWNPKPIEYHEITWKNYNGDVLSVKDYEANTIPVYNGATPNKPSTEQYSYMFSGWDPEVVPVTSDAEYTATFDPELRSYSIHWLNYDSSEITSGLVLYGQTPTYAGDTPSKPSTAQYSYTFTGWTPTLVPVSGEASYTATFSDNLISYPVTFNTNGGSDVAAQNVEYGSKAIRPDNPTKAGNLFVNWYSDSGLTEVYDFGTEITGAITLYAKWEESLINNYNYEIKDNKIVITGLRSTSLTQLTIPASATIDNVNYPVTEIADYAFSGQLGITSVTIEGNNLVKIGGSAFNECTSLASINIPNTVTSIGDYAFNGCSGLTTTNLPSSLITLGEGAYQGCTSITTMTLGTNVTTIGRFAFRNCGKLTTVTNNSTSLTSIGQAAFTYCTSLTSFYIPNSTTTLGSYIFFNCGSSIHINCQRTSAPSGWDTNWSYSLTSSQISYGV